MDVDVSTESRALADAAAAARVQLAAIESNSEDFVLPASRPMARSPNAASTPSAAAASEGSQASPLMRHIARHLATLQTHAHELHELLRLADETLQALAVEQQRLRHLAALLDRAIDVDMQCVTRRAATTRSAAPVTVTVNASPLFPGLGIGDVAPCLAHASELCARGGRLAGALRKFVSTATAHVAVTRSGIHATCLTAERTLAERVASLRRQLDGFEFEIGKAAGRTRDNDVQREKVSQRLQGAKEQLRMRRTAALAAGPAALPDPVAAALVMEVAELQEREAAVSLRAKAHAADVAELEARRAEVLLQQKQVLAQLAQCRRATAVAGADATIRTPRRAASARAGTCEEAVTPKGAVASARGDNGTEMAQISSPAPARPRFSSAASPLVRASVISTPSRMQF
jgi:hypothetical protein